MGQYWQFINIDKRQTYGHLGKLGEFFFEPRGVAFMVMKDLIRIELEAPALSFKPAPAETARQPDKPQYLALLPVELLTKVFGHLDNTVDCIFLSVTSRRCWEVGAKIVQERYLAAARCNAGDRVMFVGDYLGAGDLPKRFELELTEEEELELGCQLKNEPMDVAPEGQSGANTKRAFVTSLYMLAYEKYQRHKRDPYVLLQRECVSRYKKRPSKGVEETALNFPAILEYLIPRATYAQSDLVLRNLSRREYVRGEAVTELSRTKVLCRGTNLGHVLLARVSWSSDADSVGRGAWAGDRCEIVRKGAHEQEVAEAKDWKDISTKAVSQLQGIYRENDKYLDYDGDDGANDEDLTFKR